MKERNWDLDDYLRTTIGPPSYQSPAQITTT